MVIVAWSTNCTSIIERNLGLRSISKHNDAINLKLGWDLIHSNNYQAKFLRSMEMRGNKFIGYHIFSSILSSLNQASNPKLNTKHKLTYSKWCEHKFLAP